MVKLPPPSHRRFVARWLLLFGSAFIVVGLITTLTLPAMCNLLGTHNPTIGLPTCPDNTGTLGDFLGFMAVVSLGSGIVALLAGLLGRVLIRNARAASHP